jgi:predicted permease
MRPATVQVSLKGMKTKRIMIIIGTVLAATAVWVLEDPILGVNLAVKSGDSTQHIGVVSVIVASAFVALAAWALLAWFERRMKQPHRTWTVLASVIFVLSWLGPLGGVTTGAKLGLFAFHAVVAGILIARLPRTGKRTFV